MATRHIGTLFSGCQSHLNQNLWWLRLTWPTYSTMHVAYLGLVLEVDSRHALQRVSSICARSWYHLCQLQPPGSRRRCNCHAYAQRPPLLRRYDSSHALHIVDNWPKHAEFSSIYALASLKKIMKLPFVQKYNMNCFEFFLSWNKTIKYPQVFFNKIVLKNYLCNASLYLLTIKEEERLINVFWSELKVSFIPN